MMPRKLKRQAMLLFLLGAPMAYAAELGRLFYTPQERATLDMPRTLTAPVNANVSRLTVNGVVMTSSGKSTVWLNHIPIHEADTSSDGIAAEIRRDNPANPIIELPDGRRFSLKVGQSWYADPLIDVSADQSDSSDPEPE